MSDTEQKKKFSWSDIDESPVIPTGVPKEEPPTIDLNASCMLEAPKAEPSDSPVKTHDVSAAEPSESKETVELNQEMIDKLLNKLTEFDDMPPLVDEDDMPALVYDTPSCPRCEAALHALLSGPVRRHPVINVESEEETEEDSEEDDSDSDSDYVPSSDSDESETSDPPTLRTLADRQVNVPSAIQYITVILAVLYLLKFFFYMNESRIRYRPCT